MTSIQSLLIKIAAAMGYTIYASWREERREQALYLEKLFKTADIDAVFDVGANRGQYYEFLRHEVGFQGLIFSFEPIPEFRSTLELKASLDRKLHVFSYALGKQTERMNLNVTKKREFSSFLNPKKQGDQKEIFKNLTPVEKSVEVEIKTLTEVFKKLKKNFGFINPYLKLDTQGFDLEILKGGEKVLSEFIGLQTEASVQAIYEGMHGYQKTIDWLQERGLTLSAFHSVEKTHFPELIEFDCHMIKNELVKKIRENTSQLSDR